MVETPLECAEVAEQADASVSKTDVRKDVRVRLPLSAPRGIERTGHALGCRRRIHGRVQRRSRDRLAIAFVCCRRRSARSEERRVGKEWRSGRAPVDET